MSSASDFVGVSLMAEKIFGVEKILVSESFGFVLLIQAPFFFKIGYL
ncbi:MAG: hypothetical protein ACK55Z_34495 [bacterium]